MSIRKHSKPLDTIEQNSGCSPLHEELPAGGAAVGEHPAGAGEDGAGEEAGAGESHPGSAGGVTTRRRRR
jgi:hypothetical protein